MKINIKEIMSCDSTIIVLFTTDYGEATAIWEGEIPIENHLYHIEFDINDTLIWGKDIFKTDIDNCSIQQEDNQVHISGVLESVDDDGYSVLRIGEHMVPFIGEGTPFSNGSFINLITKSVSLSPIYY